MKKILLFLLFTLMLLWSNQIDAQCVMCKAVAESAQENPNGPRGLNTGILYLMGVPYLLIFSVGFFLFRKQLLSKGK
jgi:hypothetical protein